MLYFAYGSNLDCADLDRWCAAKSLPTLALEFVGIAYLPDRRLAFTHRSMSRGGGVLDVPPSRGSAVAGALFRASHDRDLEALDRKEAEGHTYRRIDAVVLDDVGAEHAAVTYEVEPAYREPFVVPPGSYLEVVRRGYRACGIDASVLEAAARNETHAGGVTRLFVYGTLMQGEERHTALSRHRARYSGSGRTAGTLLDIGEYPGLIPTPSERPVLGELYEADDRHAMFLDLDEIEGFKGFGRPGSHYRRAIVRVTETGGASLLAWTYVFAGNLDGLRTLPSGDWRRRQHVP